MRRSEKGRSMVEMLGVLAIIGVLSVGGIYGYTVAMNKYKANEVAQAANMLATIALGKATATNAEATIGSFYAGGLVDTSGKKINDCDASATGKTDGTATVQITCASTASGVKTALENLVGGTSNGIKITVS